MKEENFKFKESYSLVIDSMNDKQAGQFIKALTKYAFNGQVYNGKDTAIKSAFALVKVDLDMQKFFKEAGKKGHDIQEENKKQREAVPVITKVVAQGETAGEFIKTLFDILNSATEKNEERATEDVAK